MSFLFGFILVACVLFLLLRSWAIADYVGDEDSRTVRQLLNEKERCVRVLRDLELDAALHNLSPADYEELREKAVADMAIVLGRLDKVAKTTSKGRATA